MTHGHSLSAAMEEAARTYVSLRSSGAPLRTVDFGGGIPVDTAAWQPVSDACVATYASVVLGAFAGCCARAGAPHPRLVCESGAAVAASSCAVLVTGAATGWIRAPQ